MTRLNGFEDGSHPLGQPALAFTPRPLTTSDCDALMSKRPHHVADGNVGDNRWWAAQYDGFDQILVTVWAGEGFVFEQRNVWFPAATPKAIDEWVATLPPPVARAGNRDAHGNLSPPATNTTAQV